MIETKQHERLRRLSECIKRSGRIHLKDAARILEVSEMTIRRDLSSDAENPFPMSLLGGYVVALAQPHSGLISTSSDIITPDQTEELHIPNLAAGMVSDGDVLFFDNGQFIPTLIELIPDNLHFTGICYSHRVFLALSQKKMPLYYSAEANIVLKVTPSTTLPNLLILIVLILKKPLFQLKVFISILALPVITSTIFI